MNYRQIVKLNVVDSINCIMDVDGWRARGFKINSNEPTLEVLKKLSAMEFTPAFIVRLAKLGIIPNKNIFVEWDLDYQGKSFMPAINLTIWADQNLFSIYILKYGPMDNEHLSCLYNEAYEERKLLESAR